MADPRQFDELMNRERQTLAIMLGLKVEKSALNLREYIQLRVSQGSPIDLVKEELIRDLREGGRIFGEFRRAIKATSRGSVNRARDAGYFSEFGVATKYRWSAVLVKTCPDCLELHRRGEMGEVKTWEEWEAEGMPRAGATVCRENCHCVLIPEEFTQLEPIKRNPRT
jgi:hypothetical protein